MEQEFFIFDCGNLEHIAMLSFDPDEDDFQYQAMYLSVFLNSQYGFFKRAWSAIKYTFGYKSQYGHFNEFTLSIEKADKMKHFILKFERFAAKTETKDGVRPNVE